MASSSTNSISATNLALTVFISSWESEAECIKVDWRISLLMPRLSWVFKKWLTSKESYWSGVSKTVRFLGKLTCLNSSKSLISLYLTSPNLRIISASSISRHSQDFPWSSFLKASLNYLSMRWLAWLLKTDLISYTQNLCWICSLADKMSNTSVSLKAKPFFSTWVSAWLYKFMFSA